MNNSCYMSGTGNNFLISEFTSKPTELEIISMVADSIFDIDGVIFIEKINNNTIKMHYFNNDGSTAELCVNGIRCVAKYSLDNNIVNSKNLTVVAPIGEIKTVVENNNVSLKIKLPSYNKSQLVIDSFQCTIANIGNPHLLVEVPNTIKFDLNKFVNKVKTSEKINEELNIEIYNITEKKYINARVHERGVGETEACGSGAICMFYFLFDTNQVDNNAIVIYPGGELELCFKDNMIELKGEVTYL